LRTRLHQHFFFSGKKSMSVIPGQGYC
jgi:hypothetical protein